MGIATSTNILYERADGSRVPMMESIKACAAAGFKELDFGFVELALSSERFHTVEWEQEIEDYLKLAQELGLRFVQAHATILDFCNPDSEYEVNLELFKRSIRGARILGAPWIVAHPSTKVLSGVVSKDTHEINIRFFREIADYAATIGIGIAIENMWGHTRDGVPRYAIRAEELLQLIESIGRKNVGACWDVEHGSVEKLNQGNAVRLLGKHLKATHISDETGANNIHILPYTGFVNWDDVLSGLADIDYTGAFAFEIQHYLPQMPIELIPSAMRFSVEVGNQMLNRLEAHKKACKANGSI